MSTIAGELLAITAEQRRQLDEIQRDIDAHLDKLFDGGAKNAGNAVAARTEGATDISPESEPGKVMTASEQSRMKLTDDQKKDAARGFQKAVEDRFSKVLTESPRKSNSSSCLRQGALGGEGPVRATHRSPARFFRGRNRRRSSFPMPRRSDWTKSRRTSTLKLATLLTEEQKRQLRDDAATRTRGRTGGALYGTVPPGGRPLLSLRPAMRPAFRDSPARR